MGFNFLDGSEALLELPRLGSQAASKDLRSRLDGVELGLHWRSEVPLVAGEVGRANPVEALRRLTEGRHKRDGGGSVTALEAWLQAEVVGAGIVAAHEVLHDTVVAPHEEERLRHAFTSYALDMTGVTHDQSAIAAA